MFSLSQPLGSLTLDRGPRAAANGLLLSTISVQYARPWGRSVYGTYTPPDPHHYIDLDVLIHIHLESISRKCVHLAMQGDLCDPLYIAALY